MKLPSRFVILTSIALSLGLGSTQAATIIFDAFDDAPSGAFNSVNLAGTTPNTNLPGGSWVVTGGGSPIASERPSNFFIAGPQQYGIPGAVPYLFMNGSTSTVSLSGFNTGQITLSCYVSPQASGGATSLGFSNVSTGSVGYGFYGFNLYNNGDLQLTLNGVQSSSVAYAGGTFDSSATAYLLSLTVDTSTGALSSVSLSGSTADYSSFLGGTSFNTTNTANVALTSNIAGSYINLTVASVPEPSTYALLLGGAGMMFYVRRRVRLTVR